MEIRNNTPMMNNYRPAFGMAFKKPSPEKMAEFTEFVTKKGNTPARLAKRGVAKLIKRHANDKHFDFQFVNDRNGLFQAEAISPKAEEMMNSGQLQWDVSAPKTVLDEVREKYFSEAYQTKVAKAGSFKAFLLEAKAVAAALKARIALEFKPVDALPKRLRNASASVKLAEDGVNKQIAKEMQEAAIAEKAAAKKAKADAKVLAAKEKAIDEISSAFDVKKK